MNKNKIEHQIVETKFSPFFDRPGFEIAYKKIFTKEFFNKMLDYASVSDEEKCLIYWFEFAECINVLISEIRLEKKVSDLNILKIPFIRAFYVLDTDPYIEFIKKVKNQDLKKTGYLIPGLEIGMNIYKDLIDTTNYFINVTGDQINDYLKRLDENAIIADIHHPLWDTFYVMKVLQYKLMDFKYNFRSIYIPSDINQKIRFFYEYEIDKRISAGILEVIKKMEDKKEVQIEKFMSLDFGKDIDKPVKTETAKAHLGPVRKHNKNKKTNHANNQKANELKVEVVKKVVVEKCKPAKNRKKPPKNKKKPVKNIKNPPVIEQKIEIIPCNEIEVKVEEKPVEKILSYPMEIELPEYVLQVIRKLKGTGHHAYIVGGAVRDALLGCSSETNDYDIVTNASLNHIPELFEGRGFLVSSRYPVFLIQTENERDIQISTLTSNQAGYNTETVILNDQSIVRVNRTNDLAQDAMRRDFTCNALYYDSIKKVVLDPCDGREDVRNGKLRFISADHAIMKNCPAVILRAIGFMARFNYSLDDESERQLINHLPRLKQENVFKINHEINKLISKNNFFNQVLALFKKYHLFVYLYHFTMDEENLLISSIKKIVTDDKKNESRILLFWAAIMAGRICDLVRESDAASAEIIVKKFPSITKETFKYFGIHESNNFNLTKILLLYYFVANKCHYFSAMTFDAADHDLVSILIKNIHVPNQKANEKVSSLSASLPTFFYPHSAGVRKCLSVPERQSGYDIASFIPC